MDEQSNKRRGYKDYLAEANAEVKAISPQEAAALDPESSLIVDIRDPRELEREGRIPGSFHAPRGMLEFWIDPESPYHKPVFAEDRTFCFHCASGWRSALAAKLAQDMGIRNVVHVEGGFSAWRESGLPVEEGRGTKG